MPSASPHSSQEDSVNGQKAVRAARPKAPRLPKGKAKAGKKSGKAKKGAKKAGGKKRG